MIPIGPIVAIAAAASRALKSGDAGGRALRRGFNPAVALVKILFGGPLAMVAIAFAFHVHVLWGLLAVFASSLVLAPGVLLRMTTIRLGKPRATYVLARLAFAFGWSGQFRSGAALLAAEALRHAKIVTDDDLAFVERKAAAAPSHATNAVTAMILAHVRAERDDDAEAAERAFALACLVDRAHLGDVTPLGMKRAFTYMLAHAAAAGDFARVADVRFSVYRFSLRAWSLRVLARSRLGRPMRAPKMQRAVAGAFLGVRGRELLARGALAEPAEAVGEADDAVTGAVIAHAAFFREPSRASAVRAIRAWDAVASSAAARAEWDRRKLALGARAASFDAFVEGACAALGDALASDGAGNGCIAADFPEAVRLRIKGALWDKLDDASRALRRRVEEKEPLAPCDEWADAARVVLLWERLAPLASATELYREFAYPLDLYSCRVVSPEWPSARDRTVAHAIAAFLHERARAADDATNAKRLADNVLAFKNG